MSVEMSSATAAAIAAAAIAVTFVTAFHVINYDGLLPNRGQPRTDFGGPVPIGTVMYKSSFFGTLEEPIETSRRVFLVPYDDYSDPVSLEVSGEGVVRDMSGTYYMARSEYEKARAGVRCESMKECRAYLTDGDAGLFSYEAERLAINSDLNDNRYIFKDGLEVFGDKILEKKLRGETIEYPSSIVYRSK